MDNISDIQRSFLQYQKHQDIGYLKLTLLYKIMLSFIFFLLLPFVIFNIFFKKRQNNKNVFVVDYGSKQPYKIINQELKATNRFKFLRLNSFYIPLVPTIFIRDILKNPIFTIKNLPFLGGLLLKISKYYFFIKYNNISKLIVLQEYSFYMSYLTRVIEKEDGKLYNIMHGIPGETYSFFRFSKCFVWGEFYKYEYIKNRAYTKQFIISGSIFHHYLSKQRYNNDESIDILYAMDGDVLGVDDVLEVLKKLSSKYKIRVKQHPRYRVDIDSKLIEIDNDIVDAISKSKVVISHYSTALLDVIVMNKNAVSYIYDYAIENKFVSYLDKKSIVSNKEALIYLLIDRIKYNYIVSIDKRYIDMKKNPIEVIINEVF